MNTLTSQCLTKVIEGLASTLEEALQTSSRTTRPVSKLAEAQVEGDYAKPQDVGVHHLDAIQLDALRKRAAEGAVALSRLATLLRAAEKLKLPSESEKPAIAKNRVLTLATKEENKNTCKYMANCQSVRVSVPSFAAREALRASRKRLRGEDNVEDTQRVVDGEGGDTCTCKEGHGTGAHRRIFPVMRSVTLAEGLQHVVGPVGTLSHISGNLSGGTSAQPANPAASSKVVIRKGRKPAYNAILGSNAGDDNVDSESSQRRSPTLGHAVRFLTETQSAERSALLRFGLFPSLGSTSALPSSGSSSSSAILACTPLAVEAAANEYERLQREADAVLTREHLTLITLSQLQADLPEIRERLGESQGEADSGIKVLRVEGGVASLSLRGMCIVNVWYNGGLRRWVLVGFMWTIFDVSGVRSMCEKSEKSSPGSTTAEGLASGTLLSLAHYSHQQIQSKIAAEASTSLLAGIIVALRCCAGAVLQHVHNRVIAASGGSTSLVIEGFMCRCKTEATRGAASVSLFCQPVVSRESADVQVTESATLNINNNTSTVVRIHYENRKGQIIKELLVGTDTDKHIMRPALETLFLRGPESTASDRGGDCPSSDSIDSFVECHLLANMAAMAGLQNIPDLNSIGVSDAGWDRLREALPPVTGTPVALLSLPRILSPLK